MNKFKLLIFCLFSVLSQKLMAQTNTTYEYDKLNRLVKVTTPVSVTTYSYDVLGNRKTKRKKIDVTSVPEVLKNNEFKIYPNPAREQVTIECPENSIGQDIVMTDLNGRLILRKEITSIKESISLDSIAPGLYIINISKNNESIVYIHKLLKQ